MDINDFIKNFANANCNDSGIDFCADIPGGFQDMDPQLYLVIGEILGNIMSGSMPLNVQNSIGNWLILIGHVILTFHAQQIYMEKGPGKYYNISNKNSDNKSCKKDSKIKEKEEISIKEIYNIKECFEDLIMEVEELKKEINKIKIK